VRCCLPRNASHSCRCRETPLNQPFGKQQGYPCVYYLPEYDESDEDTEDDLYDDEIVVDNELEEECIVLEEDEELEKRKLIEKIFSITWKIVVLQVIVSTVLYLVLK